MTQRLRTILTFTALSGIMLINACGQEPAQQEQPAEPEPIPVVASPAERIEQVKTDLEDIKLAVADEGTYLCCVEPACDWCLLHEGECKCRKNLVAKKEVCPGCGLGWHNGQGTVGGVKASQVKWDIAHSHEESVGHKH